MWFILGGEQAEAVCIQDLSVFILAIFGLGLNCIVEDGSDEDMFDDAEVQEIQTAFQIFHAQKVLRDESAVSCSQNFGSANNLRSSLTSLNKKKHKTVVEFVNENHGHEHQFRQVYDDEDKIEEELEEEEFDERAQHPYTDEGYEPEEIERQARLTLKSRTNNDASFISRNNPPKSFMSTTSSPMLLLDVNLGGGKIERVMMHEGDDPEEIADRIVQENSTLSLNIDLDSRLREKFLRILEEQLSAN